MKQEMMWWQWHQLDHVQIINQTENYASTSSLNFTGRVVFLTPSQQCQTVKALFIIQ